MTDYTDMSDGEIDHEVAKHSDARDAYGSYPRFCNDWAAIGELIYKNQIEINITQCAAGNGPAWWCHRSKVGDDCYSGYQPTPMRAAAITFLLIQDSKYA